MRGLRFLHGVRAVGNPIFYLFCIIFVLLVILLHLVYMVSGLQYCTTCVLWESLFLRSVSLVYVEYLYSYSAGIYDDGPSLSHGVHAVGDPSYCYHDFYDFYVLQATLQ